jgi:hypothetical protein
MTQDITPQEAIQRLENHFGGREVLKGFEIGPRLNSA